MAEWRVVPRDRRLLNPSATANTLGFTLIALLVKIAIIGLPAALILLTPTAFRMEWSPAEFVV
jgi:type II secretory pathway pseudopilin PulG